MQSAIEHFAKVQDALRSKRPALEATWRAFWMYDLELRKALAEQFRKMADDFKPEHRE